MSTSIEISRMCDVHIKIVDLVANTVSLSDSCVDRSRRETYSHSNIFISYIIYYIFGPVHVCICLK